MKKQEKESKLLKDLIDKKLTMKIASSFSSVDQKFNKKNFLSSLKLLESLEMKERLHLIRDSLKEQFQEDYNRFLSTSRKAIQFYKFQGVELWPILEYVQKYGLCNSKSSLMVLIEWTKIFTAEWAIRPYLNIAPDETLLFLKKFLKHPHKEVRRFLSEGTRPRIPWGEKLTPFILDPMKTYFILDALKYDDELYIRKSVANHINDISKDHPHIALKIMKEWNISSNTKEEKDKIEWITKHALRTLIKKGDLEALKLLGIKKGKLKTNPSLKLIKPKIKIGEKLHLRVEFVAPVDAIIDYKIYFLKSNQAHTEKVFKLKKVSKGNVSFSFFHDFKKITTRKYYPGTHFISLQINGIEYGKKEFLLTL